MEAEIYLNMIELKISETNTTHKWCVRGKKLALGIKTRHFRINKK